MEKTHMIKGKHMNSTHTHTEKPGYKPANLVVEDKRPTY